ncbi:MAG: hypothetical protein Kow0029_18410 [Candidatus Rifleibacteriota bacterium]
MKSANRIAVLLICIFMGMVSCQSLYAEFSIDAQVDKTEVAFGESVTLVITISQQLRNGDTSRLYTPNIDTIPGFDIASTRTGHSTSFINGYGQAKSQLVLELVPQGPGVKTIPPFTFKDPQGVTHSSKSIEIKVSPPNEDPEEKNVSDDDQVTKRGKTIFRGLLVVGLIMAALIAIPFILSAFLKKKQKSSGSWEYNENYSETDPKVVDAEIIEEKLEKPVAPPIDFKAAAARLKNEFPEINQEFYRKYFELFRKAAVGQCAALSEDMTPDELLLKIVEQSSSDAVRQSADRLAKDIEAVMYAGMSPSRSFASIEEDVLLLLANID